MTTHSTFSDQANSAATSMNREQHFHAGITDTSANPDYSQGVSTENYTGNCFRVSVKLVYSRAQQTSPLGSLLGWALVHLMKSCKQS